MDDNKQKNKRILVFSQHFWPEEFRVNDICRGFVEQGFSVDVVCGIPNYFGGKVYKGWGFFKRMREEWHDINIRRVWEIPRGSNTFFRIFFNYISWPFFCFFYLPFIGRGYDRVMVYQLSPVLMAFPAIVYRFFTKTPLTIYMLDYWPVSFYAIIDLKNRLLRRILSGVSKWHYKRADNIVVVYEGIKKLLIDDAGVDPSNISFIPQSCEKIHETCLFDENLHNKYEGCFCIVFTGSINPAQSFDIIVQAAKLCYDAGLTDIHWVIVGDGMSRKNVEEMVAESGLEDNFHFEGAYPVEEMPRFYSITDAFIVALKKSKLGDFGVPAKIQSYLAAGKPILGAMDGDAAELINKNRVGLCGPSDSAEVLFENIREIYLSDESQRKEMGERAKQCYFEHFERDVTMKKLISFIFSGEGE